MKGVLVALIALLTLVPRVSYAQDEFEMVLRENETHIREAADELRLAIMTRDHARIAEHSYYEGFSAGIGRRIDMMLEDYHNEEHYSCSEIEILSVRVEPDLKHAFVAVRVHLAVSQTPVGMQTPPIRVENWEFINKKDRWLRLLHK